MLTALLKTKEQLISEIQKMEARLEHERNTALVALPAHFGYSDINDFIRELRRTAKAKPNKPLPPKKKERLATPARSSTSKIEATAPEQHSPRPPAPKSVEVTKTAAPSPQPGSPPSPGPSPTPPSVAPPTGTSLEDPANFSLLPDLSVLDRNSQDLPTFQAKLGDALKFAQKVLHTSRVQAKIWREWRSFERSAIELLRTAHEST